MSNTTINKPAISIIVAVARNGAIGKGNGLLWRLPRDLQHFKQTTLGAPIVMGRKTWDSIGRPLPGRFNIVVTRQAGWSATGAHAVASLDDAVSAAAASGEGDVAKLYVIGGAQIYADALAIADELVITEVDADFEGDAFFPTWDRRAFEEVSRSETFEDNGLGYRFVTYARKPQPTAIG